MEERAKLELRSLFFMDADQILQSAHRTYQGDVSYPESGEDDYDLRFALIEDGVNAWALRASEENIRWKELFVSLADAADGDKEAESGTTSYATPSDFVELSSKVTIGSTIYDVVSPDKVLLKQQNDPNGNWCYITGNEDLGYTLHINQPLDGTINYDYYAQPSIPTTGTEYVQMKRPYFVVHFILARLFELDGRNDLTTFHEAKMKNILDAAVIENELGPEGNSDPLEDISYTQRGVRFGK
jgi:hypothetical protein